MTPPTTSPASLDNLTLQWLLHQGCDPIDLEQPGPNGDTALLQATRAGELAVVQALIQAGVDLNARNYDRNNALWFACFRDRHDLIELLVGAGIDLNNQNVNGATALMYAASAGKTAIVQTLLAAGADTRLTNLDDFRAIDFAANLEILRILQHVV
ncbi:MAG: ankyrin repeat domain-containing protein [Elainella sp.]